MERSYKEILARIDYPRLAGVSSVLGIEIEKAKLRVVELRRKGNPLDRLSGDVVPGKSFTYEFRGRPLSEVGRELRTVLKEHGIKTRSAVVGIRKNALRVVAATVPREAENASEWIEEHSAKLLRLPVGASEIVHSLTEIEKADSGTKILVTFVKRSERDECVAFAHDAGLDLLALSDGLSGLLNVSLIARQCEISEKFRIVHLGDSTLALLCVINGRVKDIALEPLNTRLTLYEAEERGRAGSDDPKEQIFIAGSYGFPERAGIVIKPFALPSDYAVAAGLALQGLIPAPGAPEFLPEMEKSHHEDLLARSLFRRAALVCGMMAFLALLTPYLASTYIAGNTDEVEGALIVSSRRDQELESLEKEVAYLRESSNAGTSSTLRSHSAYELHEIARLTPQNVQLSSLSLDGTEGAVVRATFKGHGASEESVSEYLKTLKGASFCRGVSLQKLDVRGSTAENEVVPKRRAGVYFELSAMLGEEGIPR